MAETLKRLGATAVVADTNTELGGPGTGKTWVVATFLAVNRGATDRTFRLAHIDGDLADIADEDYIAYDYPIEANGVVPFSLGACVEAGHTILCRANHADVHFIMWGSEIT